MMFKKIAYSVVLGGMLAGLGACSAEPDYKDGTHLMGEKFSFYQGSLSSTMLPGNAEYQVDIIRTTTQGAVTLPLTLESVDDRVLDGVTVSDAVFADGSNKATVTISIANAMPPNVYGGKLSMAEDKVSVTGNVSLNFRIGVEYDWEEMDGTGWFKDVFIGMPWQEIKFQKAVGFNRWRAMAPYLEYINSKPDTWVTYDPSISCAYVEFYDTNDGYLSFDEFVPGFEHPDCGVFHCVPGSFVGKVGDTNYNLPSWGMNNSQNFWVADDYVHLSPAYLGTKSAGWWDVPSWSDNGIYMTLPGYED